MTEPELIEDFFGVYLLYSINPKFKGRTYIGYTRDPNRRILQHNRGTWAGGAFRTNNKGPWKMVLVVHGFPNNISALRFEWAWQNPTKTIRLQHLNLKRVSRKETEFQFKLRILSEMLRIGPWSRLPLLIRWLKNDFREEFSIDRKPPDHMIVCSGSVKSRNLQKNPSNLENDDNATCLLCSEHITDPKTKLKCINQECKLIAHIVCLAELFLEPGEYVPVNGTCPFCSTTMKWGDLIRKLKGCSQESTNGLEETSDVDDEIEFPDAQDSSDDLNYPNSPCVRVSLDDPNFADNEILNAPGSPNISISSHDSDNADALVYPHLPGSSSVPHSNSASTSTSKTNTQMDYDNFDWQNCENDLW